MLELLKLFGKPKKLTKRLNENVKPEKKDSELYEEQKDIFFRLENEPFVAISANRSDATPEKNLANYNSLSQYLAYSGYFFVSSEGGYSETVTKTEKKVVDGKEVQEKVQEKVDVVEPSFVVFPNMKEDEEGFDEHFSDFKDEMLSLARKYNQE